MDRDWPLENPGFVRSAATPCTQRSLESAVRPDGYFPRRLDAASGGERRHEVHTIHKWFEQYASRCPDAPAVSHDRGVLTYQELNVRANQLARRLLALGLRPQEAVGICLQSSPNVIVGLLGILKAGGAYAPLDSAHPVERLAFMIRDTKIRFILTQSDLTPRLPPGAQLFEMDAEASLLEAENTEDLRIMLPPESLAYVMYTSGSTGQPKGVAIPHRGVVRLVKGNDFAWMGAEEVYLHLAPLTFDASTLEIWAPLLNGGRVALMPAGATDLGEIGAAIRRHGVTSMWLTAGLFHTIVDTDVEILKPLRQILAGGDVLSVPHVRKAMDALPHCRFINGYGPTENTTFTCCHTIRPEDLSGPIPIGLPIVRTHVRILDAQLRPVPDGEEGELYIGGDGLALGYINRPELTAERFIQDPFSAEPHARLYRSGDRVRAQESGEIEFRGRVDRQVKARGYRIEPGEIEAVLAECEGVRQVAVITRELCAGDRELIAYYTGDGVTPLTTRILRMHAEARLPHYMVPSRFVPLAEMPLNQNGKQDRAALPSPDSASEHQPPYVEPEGNLEHIIARLWQETLGTATISVNANFFEVGGTSLRLAQVHCRLQSLIGRELPITRLLQYPTIALLARWLSSGMASPALNDAQERARHQKEALARQRLLRGARA